MNKLIISTILFLALFGCASQTPSSVNVSSLILKMDKDGSYSYEGTKLSFESFKNTLDSLNPSITNFEMEVSENLNMGNLLKVCNYLKEIKIKKDVYYVEGVTKKSVFCV